MTFQWEEQKRKVLQEEHFFSDTRRVWITYPSIRGGETPTSLMYLINLKKTGPHNSREKEIINKLVNKYSYL